MSADDGRVPFTRPVAGVVTPVAFGTTDALRLAVVDPTTDVLRAAAAAAEEAVGEVTLEEDVVPVVVARRLSVDDAAAAVDGRLAVLLVRLGDDAGDLAADAVVLGAGVFVARVADAVVVVVPIPAERAAVARVAAAVVVVVPVFFNVLEAVVGVVFAAVALVVVVVRLVTAGVAAVGVVVTPAAARDDTLVLRVAVVEVGVS